MPKNSFVTITDQFCGAGGSSLGATAAGGELKLALNHWKLAIETHNSNFPNAAHECTDISACDPRRYPSTDILITSPECFVAGTLILAKRGLIPIESVIEDDEVLTHLNRWRRVVRIQSRRADTIVVAGQGNTVGLEVTANHRLWIRQQTQRWDNAKRDYDRRIYCDPQWIAAGALLDAKYRWATPAHIEPLSTGTPPSGFGQEPILAWWLVGRWLGDGSLSFGHNSETIITSGYQDAALISEKLGQTGADWRKHNKRTAANFSLWNTELRDWLDENFGHGAAHKGLPSWVYSLPTSSRKALLDGYVSADGHVDQRRTRTDTVSYRLALGIRLLAEGLGYRAGIYRYEQHTSVIEGRSVNVLPIFAVAWENNGSERAAFEIDGHSWGLVKTIIPGRADVEVFNLEVEEDHSYVADGIVVANCTNHSLAKGKERKNQRQMSLFDKPVDPSEERSRATMWDVCRFAEAHRYNIVIVENVVDARYWVTWDAWLHAMHLLGYEHHVVYFNSMFAHPTPQSRDRMYVVFWRKGNKAPDLDFRPRAHCAKCAGDVAAVQSWKKEGSRWGRYKKQYVYVCPTCASQVEPYYYCAANAIDWSLPAPRIGDRRKPLKEKTLARIRAGLEKFAARPFLYDAIHTARNDRHGDMVWPVTAPGRTQIGQAAHGLIMPPFTVELAYSHSPQDRCHGVDAPLTTQTSRATLGMVIPPYLVDMRNNNVPYAVTEALSTFCASATHHYLVVPPFLASYYNTDNNTPIDEAVPTVTSHDRHGLVVPPFILSYYTRDSGHGAALAGVHESLPTQPTWPVHYLAQPGQAPTVEECGFRMLHPHEIQTAMAFPADYKVLGTAREKVKQLGNAVTPPVMRLLLERCMGTFQ